MPFACLVAFSSACVCLGSDSDTARLRTLLFSDNFDPANCSNPTNCGGTPPVYSCGRSCGWKQVAARSRQD